MVVAHHVGLGRGGLAEVVVAEVGLLETGLVLHGLVYAEVDLVGQAELALVPVAAVLTKAVQVGFVQHFEQVAFHVSVRFPAWNEFCT